MTKIMQIVTDISSPGGDHVYICELLKYLAKSAQHDLFLLEVRSHAGGKNAFYYEVLQDLGVRVIDGTAACRSREPLSIPATISRVIKDFEIDIVHSHVFFTDLATVISKLGSELYLSLLEKELTADEIAIGQDIIASDFNLSGSQTSNSLYLNLLPGNGYISAAPELRPEFALVSTKHLGVVKSLCHEHDIETLYGRDSGRSQNAVSLNRKLQGFVSRHANHNVTIGRDATQSWLDFNPKTSYIPVGVTSVADHPNKLERPSRRDFGLPDRGRIFLFAGRLVEKKSPETLVAAFRKHVERFPEDLLILVGDGPLDGRCRQLAGDSRQIRFIPHIAREKLLALMSSVNALCLFSLEEGLPLVIQEAMTLALPILSSAVGAIPDLVRDNQSGFLLNKVSEENIVEILGHFSALSDEHQKTLGMTARDQISNFPSAEQGFEQYVQLFALLSQPSSQPLRVGTTA